jgi:hypothetical protein
LGYVELLVEHVVQDAEVQGPLSYVSYIGVICRNNMGMWVYYDNICDTYLDGFCEKELLTRDWFEGDPPGDEEVEGVLVDLR